MFAAQSAESPSFWPYIEFDEQKRATIAGTGIRLSFLVREREAYGWSPEELYFQHAGLSLSQIYSAISYYYAHKPLIDREIALENAARERVEHELKELGVGHESSEFQEALEARKASAAACR